MDVQVQANANAGKGQAFGRVRRRLRRQPGQRLGMVGERSSGEEGRSRGRLERGEVRIPE